jgi:hypothetical protein
MEHEGEITRRLNEAFFGENVGNKVPSRISSEEKYLR